MRITIDIHDGEIAPEEVLRLLADKIEQGCYCGSAHILGGRGVDAPAKYKFDPPIPADYAKMAATL